MHGEMSICASQDLFALARGARSPAFTRLLEVPIRRPASGATYVQFEGCTASTQVSTQRPRPVFGQRRSKNPGSCGAKLAMFRMLPRPSPAIKVTEGGAFKTTTTCSIVGSVCGLISYRSRLELGRCKSPVVGNMSYWIDRVVHAWPEILSCPTASSDPI